MRQCVRRWELEGYRDHSSWLTWVIDPFRIIKDLREKLPIDAMAPSEETHIPPSERVWHWCSGRRRACGC
jgi:hypothetical protein